MSQTAVQPMPIQHEREPTLNRQGHNMRNTVARQGHNMLNTVAGALVIVGAGIPDFISPAFTEPAMPTTWTYACERQTT